MRLFVDLFEVVKADLGVDLRGADVFVSEQFLHGAQVCPAAEEMHGERVAQGVGRDIFLDARAGGILFEFVPEADSAQRRAAIVQKQRTAGAFGAGEFRARVAKIPLQPVDRAVGQGQPPFAPALARHAH